MAKVSERKKIDDCFAGLDEGMRKYFTLLPELLDNVSSSEPALAYCFQRIEMGQRVGLYALLMREYRTDRELTWTAVDEVTITRLSFPDLFKRISGKSLPTDLRRKIEAAETTRDAIMHGRNQKQPEIHRAILSCLRYAEYLNAQFQSKVNFKPYGGLRGVTSKKGQPQLNKKISEAVLKGLKLKDENRK